jgi:hypothetical protein
MKVEADRPTGRRRLEQGAIHHGAAASRVANARRDAEARLNRTQPQLGRLKKLLVEVDDWELRP